ncbi:MAG: glycosyltransferase family 2 protein [Brachymonas sp.]|nr:glycosyltransferase family 2 protein [Brachymonas sp.]
MADDPLIPSAVASATHLVLIPSYNPGSIVVETVRAARQYWNPVWVVVDGSTDESPALLQDMAQNDDGLRILTLPRNNGKGAAVLHGLQQAKQLGYTHVLTMDSDGQHPATLIPTFMQASQEQPRAMVLGVPIFAADAPRARVYGRKISNFWAQFETLWHGIGDSLYGFRVYPIAPLMRIMQSQHWMRRFDFDPEAAVRMAWAGVPAYNIQAPVRYIDTAQGGVSHFQYLRDNILLTWMHLRLLAGFIWRLPLLIYRKLRPVQDT